MPSTPAASAEEGSLPAWPPALPPPGSELAAALEADLGIALGMPASPVTGRVSEAAVAGPITLPADATATLAPPATPPPSEQAPRTISTLSARSGNPRPDPGAPAGRAPDERPSGAWPARLPATHCRVGHPNPPSAPSCRRCGIPLEETSIVMIDRPLLAEAVLEDGQRIPVDRPILLGRNPTAEEIDGRSATVVRLDDPHRRLTRTHLEIRAVQWQLLAVDRDSTNGTQLLRPGTAPAALEPGRPTPIEPGDTLVLGDRHRIQLVADDR